MSPLILSKRGIGLVEVVIAIFLITIGVMAILSMQPSAWRTVGKSDYLGRGAGILHRELEAREALIMNSCNAISTGDQAPQNVVVSGMEGAVSGDATYTVNTNISAVSASSWRVTVTVTWPDQLQRGYRDLTESIIVTRQQRFQQGC